jgi:dsDNA-specific endonuclease/ATPase MutS2
MSLGTEALTLVKDVKKFEAQLAKSAKAEKGANSAIDRANKKADQIIADAQAVEYKSKQLLANALARIKVAESVEKENEDTIRCPVRLIRAGVFPFVH